MFLKRLLSFILPLALFAGQCAADAVDDLASKGRAALNAQLVKSTPCTPETLQVRREW
jgi:tyrosinase